MTSSVALSFSTAFSNVFGASSTTLYTIPSGPTYTHHRQWNVFAGKGGATHFGTSGPHWQTAGGGGTADAVFGAGDISGSGDEWAYDGYAQDFGELFSTITGTGGTITLNSNLASGDPRHWGLAGDVVVFLDDDVSATVNDIVGAETNVQHTGGVGDVMGPASGSLNWFSLDPASWTVVLKFAIGVLGEFCPGNSAPNLPSWATATGWTDVFSARSSDTGGVGQAVVSAGVYLQPRPYPPAAYPPSPLPWALTNVDSGRGFYHLWAICDAFNVPYVPPGSAASQGGFAAVIG